MTLSPVFRSPEAVCALEEKGYLKALAPALELQRASVTRIRELLGEAIDARYVLDAPPPAGNVTFLQEQFFLTLFASLFETLGTPKERLRAYALIDICIKGIITSGDNLFDKEAKLELPLNLGQGACFASIVQMLCFRSILDRVLEADAPFFGEADRVEFQRELLSRMTAIGTLEGSEEEGVDDVPTVDDMARRVHAIRGGELFALAFVAPAIAERDDAECWQAAEEGVRRLGAAFQIVDDVTDFEFDLGRRSHNLVVAQIVHSGSPEEKAALADIRATGVAPETGALERCFAASAAEVLERARREAEQGFRLWQDLGFWFPPEDASLFVRAIAGDKGDERVRQVSQARPSPA